MAAVTPARAASYGPKVEQRHPDFTLPDIATAKPVSLSDFRGQKVLLIQFASW
jgi:peroxiredoxin